uniref:Uncharacterized protein n=1 Tax=Utricularia reniformis TaxID=192314 RepID=A0A1Y0B1R0_9LAMI|nr:hypothetical protein AEK19_MT1098 [Utricularia reniformis]ART31318.1 hypothetical protein AEK19_MT1098 [Utricularia reniformis]
MTLFSFSPGRKDIWIYFKHITATPLDLTDSVPQIHVNCWYPFQLHPNGPPRSELHYNYSYRE